MIINNYDNNKKKKNWQSDCSSYDNKIIIYFSFN